jgi:hypothetical protein
VDILALHLFNNSVIQFLYPLSKNVSENTSWKIASRDSLCLYSSLYCGSIG